MVEPRESTDAKGKGGSISLSAPWEGSTRERGGICEYEGDFLTDESKSNFVTARSDLHKVYIQEDHKTRRLGLCLAAGLLALACLIPVFAPAGRETISYWIGLTLFVFAAGAMGYTNVKFTSDKRQVSVSKDLSGPDMAG